MSDISTTSPLLQEKASGPYHYYEGMDTTLTRRDIIRVAEELFDVRNNSRTLGLVLGLEKSVVDVEYRRLTDQLLQVIAEFLERKEPRPTWGVIVNALRSPLIGMHALAEEIEAKYSIVPATKSDILTTSSPLQEEASDYYEGMDTTLTRRDLVGVAEELYYDVRAKSKILGLVLGLEKSTVDAIGAEYRDPADQLVQVIAEFLEQKEPTPTWRVIVNALRSRLIDMNALAEKIEAKYSIVPATQSDILTASSPPQEKATKPYEGMDTTLTRRDLVGVAEELYEVGAKELVDVRTKSKMLGLVLGLEKPAVEVIHMLYRNPADQLVQVIAVFLRQKEPRPTWRVIVKALRSPLIRAHGLARKIEAKYTENGPASEGVLTPNDAISVINELWPARHKTFELGLKLNIPAYELQSIHSNYTNPRNRLLHIILAFLRQAEPRPTWRVIVDALRSRVVNLTALAERVEAAYLTGTLPISGGSSVGEESDDMLKVEPVSPVNPKVLALQEEMKSYNRRFISIKESTIKCLDECRVAVMTVVYMLLSVIKAEEQQAFLKQNQRELCKYENHFELFTKLDPHCNYLSCDMMNVLLEELTMTYQPFLEVKGTLDVYSKEVQEFMANTALHLFCQALPYEEYDIPPAFQRMVSQYYWPMNVTVEDIGRFRRQHALSHKLQSISMMVNSVLSDTPKSDLPKNDTEQQQMEPPVAAKKALPGPASDEAEIKDTLFVEPPDRSFFCPVTFELLLQPHLTSCCGGHISADAVSRVQGGDHPCPLCGARTWNTVLNKHFQRQVRALRVVCCYENRGCVWQGALSDQEHHIESCSMKSAPLLRDLQTQEGDKIAVSGAPILKEQSFVYTGQKLDFTWEDAGIYLYFPAATCERDIEVSVECMTHVEDDCIMPRGYRLMPMASMAYKISASAIFPAPVRVRVTHCAIVEREDALVYMVAHGEPPYRFKLLHGGRFLTNESYGEIELKEFCFITIFYNFFDFKMSLAVFVAYLKNNTVHILVTKNLPAHCTAVRSEYHKKAELHEHNMTYYNRTKAIILDIPKNKDGWRITPTCQHRQPTSISMRDIHTYQPGSVIPKVELELEWQDGSRDPQRTEVEVKLQGGNVQSLTLIFGKQPPQTSSPQSCRQQLPPAEPAQPPQPLNQSGHLPTISTQDDERDFISAKDVLVKYLNKSELRDLFNRLGLADHTLQDCFVTAGINDYAREMLKAWRNKKDNVLTSTDYPGGPTWENLRKALTDMGHHGAADEMENL